MGLFNNILDKILPTNYISQKKEQNLALSSDNKFFNMKLHLDSEFRHSYLTRDKFAFGTLVSTAAAGGATIGMQAASNIIMVAGASFLGSAALIAGSAFSISLLAGLSIQHLYNKKKKSEYNKRLKNIEITVDEILKEFENNKSDFSKISDLKKKLDFLDTVTWNLLKNNYDKSLITYDKQTNINKDFSKLFWKIELIEALIDNPSILENTTSKKIIDDLDRINVEFEKYESLPNHQNQNWQDYCKKNDISLTANKIWTAKPIFREQIYQPKKIEQLLEKIELHKQKELSNNQNKQNENELRKEFETIKKIWSAYQAGHKFDSETGEKYDDNPLVYMKKVGISEESIKYWQNQQKTTTTATNVIHSEIEMS